jgi:hypothetical protein
VLLCPLQIVVEEAEIPTDGFALTLIVVLAEAEQPLPSVPVTV